MKLLMPMLFGILAIALASGCQSNVPGQNVPAEPDSRLLELFGGDAGYEFLIHPARVEAFRVGPGISVKEELEESRVQYPEIAGPVVLPQESVKLLQAKLADENSYLWKLAKGCTFEPGVRFDFIRDDVRLRILVCFGCDELKILINGKPAHGEDFDPIRPALLQIAQQAFPEDVEIQALKP